MTTFRCFLPSWIAAWVVAIFLPSVLIAYFGLSSAAAAIGTGFDHLPATAWKVADDVGPAVKLTIGGLLLAGLLGLEGLNLRSLPLRCAIAVSVGLAAVTIAITFMPPALSRGFAAALTGARFDALVTPIYLLGGALAGLAFVVGVDGCKRRRASA